MNIEQAKTIPIVLILDKLNQAPTKKIGHKHLYFAITRYEKTPSLWVDSKMNTWRDFGDTKWIGGDGIHLVRAYLDSQGVDCEVADALRWLRNMTGFIPHIKPVHDANDKEPDSILELRIAENLKNKNLIEYGLSRGIPESVLKKYFQQATVFNKNTKKTFYALSMRNESKGYELRNPIYKGCVGRKYITLIRGTQPKPEGINIFEGAFDFVSVMTQRDSAPFKDDSLILHSLSNLKKGTAYIKNYGYQYAYTWMDNDEPGKAAVQSWTDFCQTEQSLIHVPMNEFYLPYKDVNAAHMAKLEL